MCDDYVNEKTMLQYNEELLGCIVDRSPKCTPEIAGEGIEFDWAMAKLWYRKQKLEKKKTKKAFVELLRQALSDEVVSIERTRKFSRRARLNMVGYYMLSDDSDRFGGFQDGKEISYKYC